MCAWLAAERVPDPRPLLRRMALMVFMSAATVLAIASLLAAVGLIQNESTRIAGAGFPCTGTPEQVARGAHLASILCVACHSLNGDLPLSAAIWLRPSCRIGPFVPQSDTEGPLAEWSDGELVRAIRQGTGRSGRLC